MSDPASSNPATDEKPKVSWFKVVLKTGLALILLAVLAVGFGSYYLSYPFVWPAQAKLLDQRIIELEQTIESEALGLAMDERIEQSTDRALERFSSGQSQSQSQLKVELGTVATEIDRLNAELNNVFDTLAGLQDSDQSQARRLDELSDQVGAFRVLAEDLRSRIDQITSVIEPNHAGPVTEESVRIFIAKQAQFMEAYWTLLEIEGHINRQSKALAMAGYEALGNTWGRSSNEDLKALLPLLSEEQAQLAAWSPNDWAQWQRGIQDWLVEHKRWSFQQAKNAKEDPSQSDAARLEEGEASKSWMNRVAQLFAGMVKVRPRNLGALSERDERVARANIEQRLLLLQMAVVSYDVMGARTQAAQLALEIEQLFDLVETQDVRNRLQRLAEIETSPPPDSLNGVRQAIEQVLYQP